MSIDNIVRGNIAVDLLNRMTIPKILQLCDDYCNCHSCYNGCIFSRAKNAYEQVCIKPDLDMFINLLKADIAGEIKK